MISRVLQFARSIGQIVDICYDSETQELASEYRDRLAQYDLIFYGDVPQDQYKSCDVIINFTHDVNVESTCLLPAVIDLANTPRADHFEVYRWNGKRIVEPQDRVYEHINTKQIEYLLDTYPEIYNNHSIRLVYAGRHGDGPFNQRPMSALIREVERAIDNNIDILLFTNVEETLDVPLTNRLRRLAQLVDTSKIKLVCLTSMYDTDRVISDYCDYTAEHSPHRFYGISYNFFYYVQRGSQLPERPYIPRVKPKKFIYFNRALRNHRYQLFAELVNRIPEVIFTESYTSFDLQVMGEDHTRPMTEFLRQIDQQYDSDITVSFLRNIDRLPLILNRSKTRDNPTTITLDDLEYVDNSFFSIVSETIGYRDDFHQPNTFFSEKIYKPIVYKHPFVLAGTAGALADLHRQGFQTFAPYINETYDQIQDDGLRFKALAVEIERLCRLSDTEWLSLQEQLAPILEYNHALFQEGALKIRNSSTPPIGWNK